MTKLSAKYHLCLGARYPTRVPKKSRFVVFYSGVDYRTSRIPASVRCKPNKPLELQILMRKRGNCQETEFYQLTCQTWKGCEHTSIWWFAEDRGYVSTRHSFDLDNLARIGNIIFSLKPTHD